MPALPVGRGLRGLWRWSRRSAGDVRRSHYGNGKDLGSHCIHITANDLAASGAEPLGVMLTVLLPENVEEPEIRQMMRQAEDTCRELKWRFWEDIRRSPAWSPSR